MERIKASVLLNGLAPDSMMFGEAEVSLVTTDSREVRPGCIFVAFPGERFDGHDFAAKALEEGALCVVVNHPVEGVPAEKAVLCPDSYHAMMVLGANYRSQFHPKVVGVTGSVGKTTTKQMTYAALSGFIFIHRRPDHLLSARSLSFIYSIPVRQTVLKHIHKWYISEYDKKQYRQSQEQYDRSHLTFTFFSFALRSHVTTP